MKTPETPWSPSEPSQATSQAQRSPWAYRPSCSFQLGATTKSNVASPFCQGAAGPSANQQPERKRRRQQSQPAAGLVTFPDLFHLLKKLMRGDDQVQLPTFAFCGLSTFVEAITWKGRAKPLVSLDCFGAFCIILPRDFRTLTFCQLMSSPLHH